MEGENSLRGEPAARNAVEEAGRKAILGARRATPSVPPSDKVMLRLRRIYPGDLAPITRRIVTEGGNSKRFSGAGIAGGIEPGSRHMNRKAKTLDHVNFFLHNRGRKN